MGISNVVSQSRKNYQEFLFVQKVLVEMYFPWLDVHIQGKILTAKGILRLLDFSYKVDIKYSPFFDYRFDRIYLKDAGILFNSKIHVYYDLSLCLYHPLIDMPLLKTIPLTDMVSWISEWCIHYQEWKKYKVWLGREIQH